MGLRKLPLSQRLVNQGAERESAREMNETARRARARASTGTLVSTRLTHAKRL